MNREHNRNRNYLVLCILFIVLITSSACRRSSVIPGQDPTKPPPSPTSEPIKESPETTTPTGTPTPQTKPSPTPTPTSQVEAQTTPTLTSLESREIGPFTPLYSESSWQPSIVQKLLTGPDGNIWVVGEYNVTSYDGNKWQFHGEISGHSLGFDGVGKLWIVDEQGEWIAAYDGSNWKEYGPDQGWLPAGRMFNVGMYASISEGVVTDSGGNTWLTTIHDVRVLRDEEWFIYEPEETGYIPSTFMDEEGFGFLLSDIAIDTTGDIWVTDCAWMGPGPQGQGARWYDGETWMGQDSPVVASGCIKDVEVGSDGRIWAGVDDQVWRYTLGDGWKMLPHPVQFPLEGLRWGWIFDLLLDGTDAVWMTMAPCGGASCDLGRSITFWIYEDEWLIVGDISDEEGMPDVALGANNLTWGCFANGLYTVAAGEFIPVDDDLPGVCQVQSDKEGRVWLALNGESTLWFFDAP